MTSTTISNDLQFQKSHTGFTYIKNEQLPILLPLSFITKHNLNHSVIMADCPIFFNIKNENFCFFLPDDFLKDVKTNELFQNKFGNQLGKDMFILDEKNKNQFIFFTAPSLDALRNINNNKSHSFNILKEFYENYQLDIKQGEKVIVIFFKNKDSRQAFEAEHFELKEEDYHSAIIGSSSKFEFLKAFKFNKKYYLIDENDNINQKTSFILDKHSELSMNFLVIPYTDEDWQIINKINTKISNICNKINSLFNQQQQPSLLDKSFDEPIMLENLLEYKNKPKI